MGLYFVIGFFWGFFTVLFLTNGEKEKRFKRGALYNCISFIGILTVLGLISGAEIVIWMSILLIPALLTSFIGTMIGFLFLK